MKVFSSSLNNILIRTKMYIHQRYQDWPKSIKLVRIYKSSSNQVECCQGHFQGQLVGSTGQCTWLFSGGFGATIGKCWRVIEASRCVLQECGRNDEAVMGRCSTGGGHTGNGDCPDGNVHGIYCCEIDFLSSNQTQDQDQDQDQVPWFQFPPVYIKCISCEHQMHMKIILSAYQTCTLS